MIEYKNVSGNSGVTKYEIRETEILLVFKNPRIAYVFNHEIPGKTHVDLMKRMATAGSGLSTYVAQNVGKNFADKIEI